MEVYQWFEANIWFGYLLLFLALVVPGLIVWYQNAEGRVWYKPWVWRCCWCGYECGRRDAATILDHKREEVLECVGRLNEMYLGETPEQLSRRLLKIEQKWLLDVYGS